MGDSKLVITGSERLGSNELFVTHWDTNGLIEANYDLLDLTGTQNISHRFSLVHGSYLGHRGVYRGPESLGLKSFCYSRGLT